MWASSSCILWQRLDIISLAWVMEESRASLNTGELRRVRSLFPTILAFGRRVVIRGMEGHRRRIGDKGTISHFLGLRSSPISANLVLRSFRSSETT